MKTIINYMLLCLLAVNTVTAQNDMKAINLSNAEVMPYEV
ncbi:conjugative transposon protein TraN [Myroides odoratimimus]|nr:conjugative transposon protein TraN [Myroides odoratimimus]STZ49495.1 Uncharacterised protein [Myroides odoratimimus]